MWVPAIGRHLGCGGALPSALICSLLYVPASLNTTVSHKMCDPCRAGPGAKLSCRLPLPLLASSMAVPLSASQKPAAPQPASLKCRRCGVWVLAPLPASAPAFISNLPSLPAAKFLLRAVILRPEAAPSPLSLPPSETSPELLGKHFACCYYSIPICILSHKPLLIPAFFWGGVKSSNPSFFFWGCRLTKAACGEIVREDGARERV